MTDPELKTIQRRWAIKLVTHVTGLPPSEPRLAVHPGGAVVTHATREQARLDAGRHRYRCASWWVTATPVRVRVRTEVLS